MQKFVVLGYDPGGNHSHGVAAASLAGNKILELTTATCANAGDALSWLQRHDNVIGVGVDTLAAWCLGSSGWRAADRWLKRRYPACQASVVSPNGLYGSMGINGMAVLCSLTASMNGLAICETHPKLLYFALCGERHDYLNNRQEMNSRLASWANCAIETRNDHEWDAAISAFAATQGLLGNWKKDLFDESIRENEKLVWPCGRSKYWWPE